MLAIIQLSKLFFQFTHSYKTNKIVKNNKILINYRRIQYYNISQMDKNLRQSQMRLSSLSKINPLSFSSSAKQIKNVQFVDQKNSIANRLKTMESKLQQMQTLAKKKSPQIVTTQSPLYQTENIIEKKSNNRNSQNKSNQLRGSCPLVFAKQFASERSKIQNNKKFQFLPKSVYRKENYKEDLNKTVQSKAICSLSQSINLDSKLKHSPIYKKINNIKSNFSMVQSLATSRKSVRKNNNPIIQGFQLVKLLGKGKFGQVHMARHVNTNFIVALKIINKLKIKEFQMVEQIKNEIKIHSALKHPHIVKFYGLFQGFNEIYIILEYMHGGTLFDLLNLKQSLEPSQAADYLKDTVCALNYLHDLSIAHRDIKPQNIVLSFEGTVKICDFGWAAIVNSVRKTYCGTLDYAPPQILQRKQYDISVDIWCLGVLAFELMTGRAPFQSQKRSEVRQKILNVGKSKLQYPDNLPSQVTDFIEFLMQKGPQKRPKIKQIQDHKFFEMFQSISTKNKKLFY